MKSFVAGTAAVIVGAVIGGVVVALVASNVPEEPNGANPASPASGVNATGQTYGLLRGMSAEEGNPDLGAVIATNGRVGYINTDQFEAFFVPAGSLEEAVSKESEDIVIPVFQSDGTTIIGDYLISAGKTN